jgi:hypothetical protein
MADRKHQTVCRPPEDWSEWVAYLSLGLHGRSRWRLAVVMTGMLLAGGRRTVTSWLRAAGIRVGYEQYYYFIASIGRRIEPLVLRLVTLLLLRLPVQDRVLLALDDTPTQRYGPKVQGAGLHHNPTSGPDDHKFIYGHVWVTLAWVVRHARWGAIALPLWAMLYVKQKDIASLSEHSPWPFATKLELAVQMISRLVPVFQAAGRPVWIVADGAYAYRPLLKQILPLGVTFVSRLRSDAALRTLPTPKEQKRLGARRKYGTRAISLAKRAAHREGWQQIECQLYGSQPVTKTYKTFLATYPVVGGIIRVVLVKEGRRWEPFFCTDPNASVREILETFADRWPLEQVFADTKQIWGAAQQQVRDVWCNLGCFHLNLWSITLTELWAWHRGKRSICDRSDSPWDDATRRPSHNDRRKALRRQAMHFDFSAAQQHPVNLRKIKAILKFLAQLAA